MTNVTTEIQTVEAVLYGHDNKGQVALYFYGPSHLKWKVATAYHESLPSWPWQPGPTDTPHPGAAPERTQAQILPAFHMLPEPIDITVEIKGKSRKFVGLAGTHPTPTPVQVRPPSPPRAATPPPPPTYAPRAGKVYPLVTPTEEQLWLAVVDRQADRYLLCHDKAEELFPEADAEHIRQVATTLFIQATRDMAGLDWAMPVEHPPTTTNPNNGIPDTPRAVVEMFEQGGLTPDEAIAYWLGYVAEEAGLSRNDLTRWLKDKGYSRNDVLENVDRSEAIRQEILLEVNDG